MQSIYRLQLCPREPIRLTGTQLLWNSFAYAFFPSPKAIFTICIFIIPSPTFDRKRKNPLTGRGFPIYNVARSLTSSQYEFIEREFGYSKTSFLDLPDETLVDIYYDLCDIEATALTRKGNLTSRGKKAAELAELFGDVIAVYGRHNTSTVAIQLILLQLLICN